MAWTNGGNSRTSTPQWRRIRQHVIKRDGNHCQRCGIPGDEARLECDHVIPAAEGGTDTIDNAVMLCQRCHTKKTQAEAARGRQRARAARYRPAEKHPGLL